MALGPGKIGEAALRVLDRIEREALQPGAGVTPQVAVLWQRAWDLNHCARAILVADFGSRLRERDELDALWEAVRSVDGAGPYFTFSAPFIDAAGQRRGSLPCTRPPWSRLMAIDANTVETNVGASMRGNYTYSDMTGLQLRLATNPRGFYRHIFEACPDGGVPSWTDVVFDAEVPPGTTVSFRVKTAATRDGLAMAEWVAVGSVPPAADRFSIGDALMAASITPERFLLLEIALQADRVSSTEIITPRVRSTDVTHTCEPIIE